jgi:sugar lactone lactonase YvrE
LLKPVLILLFACCVQPAMANDYDDARAEMISAYQSGDFPAMRQAAEKAVEAAPGYPGALFNLALAAALDRDAEASLTTLNSLLANGVDFGVADIPEFESLQSLPGWAAHEAALERLYVPIGEATVAFTHDVSDFVPEGIAIGEKGELYLGSIRHGKIVRIDGDIDVLSDANGHWSVFGMRPDGHGGLWFASASVPEYAGDNADAGRTGLFHLDIESRDIDVRALLPEGEVSMVLGDLVIADDDTIYTTESLTGALYRYSIPADEFTEVVGPGALRSMQGLALDASGDYLYVADYVGGLFRVTLADGRVESVDTGNPWLFGIDGLYSVDGGLVATQNGIRPNRVLEIDLADDGLTVAGTTVLARNLPEFDEPTLGVVVGDEFFFVANSHWNRFDAEGNLPAGLTGPVVLKLSLD